METLLEIQQDVRLAPFTTLKIGGNARLFISAKTESDVTDALQFARSNGLDVFILGGGSNLLISDNGFDGLVIHLGITGIILNKDTDGTDLVTAAAGEDWDRFVSYCVDRNLAGIECLSGIPGLVGGTPVQNVGAYGQEVAETIVAVRCLDRNSGKIATLTNAECGFSYRTSIFNSTHRERFIVLSVAFGLHKDGEPKLAYKDLIEYFVDRRPNLHEVREAVLKIRRSKSMVIDAHDPNSRSAGSFFKNPIVGRDKLDQLIGAFGGVPYFEFGDNFKIPAAWLIENAGFHKGYVLGDAGISMNHSLALINRDRATAGGIIKLKERIQQEVERKFEIELDPEPVFVGF